MTRAATTPPLSAADIEAAAALLRERGHRVSAARRLVLMALFAADRPVSAEEIAHGLGGQVPRSDIASVYRNLETLEDVGLVRHVHLGHGPGRYRLAGVEEHAYVVCERCDRVDPIESAALDRVRAAVRESLGYDATFEHFPIVGLCPACAQQAAP